MEPSLCSNIFTLWFVTVDKGSPPVASLPAEPRATRQGWLQTQPAQQGGGSNCRDTLTCAHLFPRGISKCGSLPGEIASEVSNEMYSQPAGKFTAQDTPANLQLHSFNEMFGGEGLKDFPSRHDTILAQQVQKKDQLRTGKTYFQIQRQSKRLQW